MSLLDDFRRVTRGHPCPVCQHPDWCLLSRDDPDHPSQVICARVESDRRWGDAGWMHQLESWPSSRPPVRSISLSGRGHRLEGLNRRYQDEVTEAGVQHLAAALSVSPESLRRLGVGWTGFAWSFPMKDANGAVTGIHLRFPDGAKKCVRGSRLGIFVPWPLPGGSPLFVCEGASDTAAFLGLGLNVIGRSSCSSCTRELGRLVRAEAPREVVLVADADSPGRRGARRLAADLRVYSARVRVVEPPAGVKDARDWVRQGVTRDRVLCEASRTPLTVPVSQTNSLNKKERNKCMIAKTF